MSNNQKHDDLINRLNTKKSTSKSVNKWKIPHYYKRSNSQQSPLSASSENMNSNDINLQSPKTPKAPPTPSSKKILLDSSNGNRTGLTKTKKTSKKRNGKMTFVNYTVQDSPQTEEQPSDIPNDSVPQNISNFESSEIKSDLTPKKKSSRNRVLKMFGSSKLQSPSSIKQHNSFDANTPTSIETSDQSAYHKFHTSSILKHGLFDNHNNKTNELNYKENSDLRLDISNKAIEYNPVASARNSDIQPQTIERPGLSKSSTSSSFSNVPSLTIKSNRSVFMPCSQQMTRSAVVTDSSDIQYKNDIIDHNEENAYSLLSTYSSENLDIPLVQPLFNEMYDNNNGEDKPIDLGSTNKPPEENDASVAFNKIFTRNRTSTMVSQSSYSSTATNNSSAVQLNLNIPSFQRKMSISSNVSSTPYHARYSPGRAISPIRPRSRTLTNSMNRLSKDLTMLENNGNLNINVVKSHGSELNISESYLDNKNATHNNTHKKQQASISDLLIGSSTMSLNAYNSNTSNTFEYNNSPRLATNNSMSSSDFSVFDQSNINRRSAFLNDHDINGSILIDATEEYEEDEVSNDDHDNENTTTNITITENVVNSIIHDDMGVATNNNNNNNDNNVIPEEMINSMLSQYYDNNQPRNNHGNHPQNIVPTQTNNPSTRFNNHHTQNTQQHSQNQDIMGTIIDNELLENSIPIENMIPNEYNINEQDLQLQDLNFLQSQISNQHFTNNNQMSYNH